MNKLFVIFFVMSLFALGMARGRNDDDGGESFYYDDEPPCCLKPLAVANDGGRPSRSRSGEDAERRRDYEEESKRYRRHRHGRSGRHGGSMHRRSHRHDPY